MNVVTGIDCKVSGYISGCMVASGAEDQSHQVLYSAMLGQISPQMHALCMLQTDGVG